MDVLQNSLIFLFSFMFLNAGMMKYRHSHYSQQALEAYQLTPKAMSKSLNRCLFSFELLLVPALIIPATQALALYLAALLLSIYALAIAINLLRGRKRLDCGCNGPEARQSISWWLVLRNISMVLLLLWVPAQSGFASPTVYVLALLCSAAIILLRQGAQLLYQNQQHMNRNAN